MLDIAFKRGARWLAAAGITVVSTMALAQQSSALTSHGGAGRPASPAGVPASARGNASQPAAGLDLAALANGYTDSVPTPPVSVGPVLMVFISFSMPQASLQRLVEQAETTGAVLVLRGLEGGSMMATAKRIKELIGQRQVQFQIDPLSFDRYGVRTVPTFVLAANGAPAAPCSGAQCFSSAQFASVSGDVSIGYALEQIERRAPRFRDQASAMRKKAGG